MQQTLEACDVFLPREATQAGIDTFSRLNGMVTPFVLASEMCRVIAAELIKVGALEQIPSARHELKAVTCGSPDQPPVSLARMVRLGATPCEVFGKLGDAQNDRVLPDARSYRASAKMPFGRPQNHLREWQREIDHFLARHPRAQRATPPG